VCARNADLTASSDGSAVRQSAPLQPDRSVLFEDLSASLGADREVAGVDGAEISPLATMKAPIEVDGSPRQSAPR